MTVCTEDRVQKALEIACQYGGIDGADHKMWTIDQMVRALTGCPIVEKTIERPGGEVINYEDQGESEEYLEWVRNACDGEDGPDTYEWDEGCPP